MQHALILLSIGLLLNVFHKFDAELNVIPRDAEVMVNESTYMNCSTTLEAEKVQWRHGNNYVYAGRNILEPYYVRFSVEINSSTRTSILVIRSVKPSDAGEYECSEDEGFGEQRSAQLIVLDDDPVCESNMSPSGVIGPNTCDIEPDEVKLSCSITYHGNTFPILQWRESGDNHSITKGLSSISSSKNVTYTLTMNSTLALNNSSFICQTTRTSKRNYSCSSDVIKILYVFSSKVTINMTLNDEVTCFANTSQSCSYKWKWYSGEDSITVSNDQTLRPNRVGRHRCEATCSIGNNSCTVEPIYAEVYSTLATTRQKELASLVLIALPVIVAIVVIYCCRKKIRYKRTEELATSSIVISEVPSEPFDDGNLVENGELIFVTGMKIYTRKWFGHNVVGGMEVFYNTGDSVLHGTAGYGYEDGEFHLDSGEQIISVTARIGAMIDQLTFETNHGNTFGPFGGNGGGERHLECPCDGAYLAYITGRVDVTQSETAVRRLRFVWGFDKFIVRLPTTLF